jgi:hypothetical protein
LVGLSVGANVGEWEGAFVGDKEVGETEGVCVGCIDEIVGICVGVAVVGLAVGDFVSVVDSIKNELIMKL